MTEAPEVPSRRRRRLMEDGVIVLAAVAVAILVRAFVAQAYWIPTGSMIPQLNESDRVVVSRLAYHLHPVHRGDIIVFKAPPGQAPAYHPSSDPAARALHDAGVALGFAQDQSVFIKRVVGLPGETVSWSGGHIYIDGDLLVEPYLHKSVITTYFSPVTVPAGQVFVMGDNRTDSRDSRVFGPIPESSIIGRAVWKVWPFWDASFL